MIGLTAAEIERVLGERPRVIAALDRAAGAAGRCTDPDLLGAAEARIASLLGAAPSASTEPNSTTDAVVAFTEQWVVDVASMPSDLVSRLRELLGDDGLMNFVHALLVREQRIRLGQAWRRLGFLPDGGSTTGIGPGRAHTGRSAHSRSDRSSSEPRVPVGRWGDRELGAALSEWQAAVVCLDGVDPLTTELVRLRCANYHDCHT